MGPNQLTMTSMVIFYQKSITIFQLSFV
jgi:hypothetical protein